MTTAVYSVRVIGLDELQRRLEKYPKISQEVLRPAISSMVIKIEGEVKRETPVHTGHLRSSVDHRVISIGNDVQGIVGTPVSYAPPVEFGSKPHWPPIAPLKRWAHLVLGDASAGYAVVAAIAKRGTKPRKMFEKGFLASRKFIHARFVRARDDIVRRLAGDR